MQDFEALQAKSLSELREIGKAMGIDTARMKKGEIVQAIVNPTAPQEAPVQDKPSEEHTERKAGMRQRIKRNEPAGHERQKPERYMAAAPVAADNETPEIASTSEAAHVAENADNSGAGEVRRRGRRPANTREGRTADESIIPDTHPADVNQAAETGSAAEGEPVSEQAPARYGRQEKQADAPFDRKNGQHKNRKSHPIRLS